MQLTLLEPGGGGTKDEIGSSLDMATEEIEPAPLPAGIEGILISQEPAVSQDDAVTFGVERHRLCYRRSIVLDGEVLQGDSLPSYHQGIGPEGSHVVEQGMVVEGDDGPLPVLPYDPQVAYMIGNHHLFVIGSLPDKNLREEVGIKGPHRINRLLQRPVITPTPLIYHNPFHRYGGRYAHQVRHQAIEIKLQVGVALAVPVVGLLTRIMFLQPAVGNAISITVNIGVIGTILRPPSYILLAVD